MSIIIPFGGKMGFFSLKGLPAYYISIGLGVSRGAPHQNQHLAGSFYLFKLQGLLS
jgi:hypothetical protein